MITLGARASAFSLQNENEEIVCLSHFLGSWVVLYFYPKDDTPGCTTEAREFSHELKKFSELNSVVLGCSPDEPQKHRAFIKKHKLRIGLLSDPKRTVMKKYGAWREKNLYGKKVIGVVRSAVLIDDKGIVVYHWRSVKSLGHAEKVQKTLKTLQMK